MSNYTSGHQAEKDGAAYLAGLGYTIRELNWKTRYCEIDIVAEKDKTIYFVEVKSRKTDLQGSGFEYITPKKLQQMHFAAEIWVSQRQWTGDYELSALSIDSGRMSFIARID